MTIKESERIATLEQLAKTQAEEIGELRADVKEILQTLNSLTGAKKALMWLTGVVLTAFGIAAAVFDHFRR